MTQKIKRPAPKEGSVQHPKRREGRPAVDRRRLAWSVLAAAIVAVALGGLALVGRGDSEAPLAEGGLPAASDYHSLLVDPEDARTLLLGTHDGLYRSTDGGSTWRFDELAGRDAMSLARPTSSTVWAAGHDVLARSTDGGETWLDVAATGLPSLDVHGFAVAPGDAATVFAAIAGAGLYRSRDGGESFERASAEVGANVMALAVLPDGRILAGDMREGVLSSADGGRSWSRVHEAGVVGLAVHPADGSRVLAGGPGVLLSTDGAASWRRVLELPDGAGPVAWSPSDPRVAYAIGFDRRLYRSADRGETWAPVSPEPR